MANRNFPSQKVFGMHIMPVHIDAQIAIGASGAPAALTSSNAAGIKAITRLAAGIYEIQLQDNYARLLELDVNFSAPVSGGNVTAGSFSTGVAYQITALGNTNFHLVGVPSDVTPAVGVVFVATGAGTGTGTAKILASSGISSCEQIGSLENSNNPTLTNGARIIFKCLSNSPSLTLNSYTPAGSISVGVIPVAAGTAGDAVTNNAGVLNSTGGEDVSINAQTFTGTPAVLTGSASAVYAPADPANGSTMFISILLNNSQVQ